MKDKLLEFIHSLGITETGVAKADDGEYAVVCLFPYYIRTNEKRTISRYAVSEDYHIIVSKYLDKIAGYIREKGFCAESFSDIGKPVDRKNAQNAGLGFFGQNGMLINEKYGSFIFIGYVKTNMPLEPDKPLLKECQKCGNCRRACPGDMARGVCASEISQRRGELSSEEKEILIKSGLIWGCDICQEVCPHNRNIEETPLPEFRENLILSPDIVEIMSLSNKEFEKKYKTRAFSWRGKQPLVRNWHIFKELKKNF